MIVSPFAIEHAFQFTVGLVSVTKLIPNTLVFISPLLTTSSVFIPGKYINGTCRDLNNGMLLESSWAVVIIGGFDSGAIVDDNDADRDNIFRPQAVF